MQFRYFLQQLEKYLNDRLEPIDIECVKLFLTFLFIIGLPSAFAQYYKTLPKGVRLGVIRNVKTGRISSDFNNAQAETPYHFEIDASAKNLGQIADPDTQALLQTLEELNPEAYNSLTAGSYEINGSADIEVNGYGLAYGLSDKVSLYTIVPVYQAKVNVDYRRTKQNSYQETARILQTSIGSDLGQAVGNLSHILPDINGKVLQNILVNNYNYKEVGNWEGEGLGDIEIGAMWNFDEGDHYGLLWTNGFVAPTGYVNDPDLLQDVGFGDGQWDLFTEFGGSYVLNSYFIVNSWVRYTHQLPTTKELRIVEDQDLFISDRKGDFKEKLGDIWDYYADIQVKPLDWMTFKVAHLITQTDQARYKSPYTLANQILEMDTKTTVRSMRYQFELSSVNSYLKKSFFLPGEIRIAQQTMLEGKNTPKFDRYELEFRMYF